jgi:phosphoglycolate phosphatase
LNAGALVLFDIDGTLLRRSGSHHKRALIEAIRSVLQREASLANIPTHGMLDCDLLRLMIGELQLSEALAEDMLPELRRAAQDSYLANCPSDLRTCVCPGVVPLLNDLQERGIPVALVTGNLTEIGWRKIELAGLRRYFVSGAFSEQAPTRTALAQAAAEQMKKLGLVDEDARISLIGDHPNDIRAARANSMQAIATATGLTSIDELRKEEPDILVQDLSELTIAQLL